MIITTTITVYLSEKIFAVKVCDIKTGVTIQQQWCQWKCHWKIDFVTFETFLPLCQVTQLLESWEVRLELKREDRIWVRSQMVEFVVLPFPFSSQLKIWSFHIRVVLQWWQRNVQISKTLVQSCCLAYKTYCVNLRCSYCRCCWNFIRFLFLVMKISDDGY